MRDLEETMDMMDISQIDELIKQLETKVSGDASDLRSLVLLGTSYYLRGQMRKAIDIYNQAIQVNPRSPYAYYYLGIALYRNAQVDEAIDALARLVSQTPAFAMAYYWLGIAYYHKGMYKESREAFEVLLKNNAETLIAHYHAARACMADEAFQCALPHLEALIASGSKDPQVLLYLGQVYYRLHRVPEAIATYRKGLQINPDNEPLRQALSYLIEVAEP
jgi:cytochrome c-type biogenesis protein CcmH/NrfG